MCDNVERPALLPHKRNQKAGGEGPEGRVGGQVVSADHRHQPLGDRRILTVAPVRVGRRHRVDDHGGERYPHGAFLEDFGMVVPVLLRIGRKAARHEVAGIGIAGDFFFGQRRGGAVVGTEHDVLELMQQREG